MRLVPRIFHDADESLHLPFLIPETRRLCPILALWSDAA